MSKSKQQAHPQIVALEPCKAYRQAYLEPVDIVITPTDPKAILRQGPVKQNRREFRKAWKKK